MNQLSCAILDDYQKVALAVADWSRIANSIHITQHSCHFSDEDTLVNAIGESEIVVAMRERTPFGASVLKRLPRLRLLVTTGMRNSSIDIKCARDLGITVSGTSSASEPPAELTWTLIHGLARKLVQENDAFRSSGPWQHTIGDDLHGKQLGILGLGKIGTRVAKVGLAFGMKVVAWSQNLTEEQATNAGVTLAESKDHLLQTSDFVTIHLVLSDRTRGLLGTKELRQMRPTAYLINTSRSAIVDASALHKAIAERWIAGVGLDVFDEEPVPAFHRLRELPGLLATPHLGYVTAANYARFYTDAVEDIQAFIAGTPIRVFL